MNDKKLNHIAIIMDGNRRWAKQKKLHFSDGHRHGVKKLIELIDKILEYNVSYLTLYTFSTENWHRKTEEITAIMKLLIFTIDNYAKKLYTKGIAINFIGDYQKLDKKIINKINKTNKSSPSQAKLQINIAFNYGGRHEIINAIKKLGQDIISKKLTNLDDLDEKLFSQKLYTKDIPDPDLLIRTGGKKRISNFLLWQLSYTELYFTDILWPDFSKQDLENAIKNFEQRNRSFGGN